MRKAELLDNTSRERDAMEALLTSLDETTLETPGVYDELSVKDVIARLAAWASMQAGWLETALRGEEVKRFAPGFLIEPGRGEEVMDRLNSHMFAESRQRGATEVLAGFREAHDRLVAVVSAMSEDDLIDPDRFDWWRGEPVWTSIAGNSYEHYAEHRALIEDWLGRGKR